ncbi:MAG: hypothetical protein RIB47_01150 [Cyclobacteriaceae bacterium]
MKFRLLIILTLSTIPSFGQDIEKIIFTSQQADEPPTKQGRPKYKIEFKRQVSGDFTTSDFYEGKKKKRLTTETKIDRERTKRAIKWQTIDKRNFTALELEFDPRTLKTGTYKNELSFDIPTDFIVNVDSFQFCQTYKMTKTISTGGETITVTWISISGQRREFIFNSNDIGEGKFNIKDYLLCYELLHDKVPSEIPYHDFFSNDKLTDILLNYQKTVECEGYYYKEYTDKNPNLTPQDRRTKKGWDFVEYMRQRNIKE